MKPTEFPEANLTLGKPTGMTDEECQSLHVLEDGGEYLSLWRMSWRERLSAVVFGRAWLCVRGDGHPPVWIRVKRDIFDQPSEGAKP